MTDKTEAMRAAAQAVLDRWDSPQWQWTKHGPTADLMADLRAGLDGFLALGNETKRAAKYDRWIDALAAAAPHPAGGAKP